MEKSNRSVIKKPIKLKKVLLPTPATSNKLINLSLHQELTTPQRFTNLLINHFNVIHLFTTLLNLNLATFNKLSYYLNLYAQVASGTSSGYVASKYIYKATKITRFL